MTETTITTYGEGAVEIIDVEVVEIEDPATPLPELRAQLEMASTVAEVKAALLAVLDHLGDAS